MGGLQRQLVGTCMSWASSASTKSYPHAEDLKPLGVVSPSKIQKITTLFPQYEAPSQAQGPSSQLILLLATNMFLCCFFNAHNVCTSKSLTALSTSCMEQMCSSVVGRGVCVSGQDFPHIHKKSFMSWQHREAETLEGRRKRRGRHLQVCWIVLTSPFRGMDGRSGGGLWTGVVVPEMLLIIH